MSPVSGRYQASSDSTNSSTMFFSSSSSNSQSYGSLNVLPGGPYNEGTSDRYFRPNFNPHVSSDPQRSHRLPPPQSLVAGVPWAPDSIQLHVQQERRYHAHPTYHQDGSSSNAASIVPSGPAVASQPPSHLSFPRANSQRALSEHKAPDLPQSHQQLVPPALGSGGGYSADPVPVSRRIPAAAPRYSQQPEPSPPQALPFKPHQLQPPPDTYSDLLDADQQISRPASAIKTDDISPQPILRPQQADGIPSAAKILNLLGPSRADALIGVEFRLRMRQQPNAARACGFGDRDRRVIDPPPIVQLVVEASCLSAEEVRTYLRYESYVMSCSIYDESGTRDSSYMPDEYQNQRRLMGSLISTPFVGQDENNVEGCFFCFPDLSCRTPGTFRLKFTLMMIDPSRAGVVKHFPILAGTMSEPFKVYNAKEFPGMVASSKLAKRLKEQGCIISIKKGNERSKNSRTQDDLSDNEDDEIGEASGNGQRKRRAIGS